MSELPKPPEQFSPLISGEAVTPANAATIAVINPDTAQPLAELVEADSQMVDQAVQAAQDCFMQGDWSRSDVSLRQQVLSDTADLIEQKAELLASMDSLCTGLLFHRSTLRHTYAAANWFRYFADLIGRADETLENHLSNLQATVTREPVGVVGLYTPWNIPLMATALKLSAALAMGNSGVLKPSEQSPWSALVLADLLYEAGLPKGALHIVNGRGAVTGAALAEHKLVGAISFTGGENAGRLIYSAASQRFAKVTLELGGKSANIIFDDAHYEQALEAAVTAAFGNNGQACLAGSRLLLQHTVAERFIEDFSIRTKALRMGRPFDKNADIGPQSSLAQQQRVMSFIEHAKQDGDELLLQGQHPDELASGYYLSPTIAIAKSNASRICQQEIFGPFASIVLFDDEEEAVNIANDTAYGLAAYIWTSDKARAKRVAQGVRAGYVLINTGMQREPSAPFGGYAASGVDREGGRWSLDFYSESKTTVTAI